MERMAAPVSEVGGGRASPQKQGSLDRLPGGTVSLVSPQLRVTFKRPLSFLAAVVILCMDLFFLIP